MVEYGFEENVDYRAIAQKRATAQGNETTYVDHEISLDMAKAVTEAVKRFNSNDWGNLTQEDIEANNADLQARDGHILAKYNTPEGNIYINMYFMEDHEQETIMFCNEY